MRWTATCTATTLDNTDLRNYGGRPALCAKLEWLRTYQSYTEVIAGGNDSLTMMYQYYNTARGC